MWIRIDDSQVEETLALLAEHDCPAARVLEARIREQQQDAVDPVAAALLQAARDLYAVPGELEFDDGAVVSGGGDPGAYVMGWRWVYNSEAGLPDEEEENTPASGDGPLTNDNTSLE